MKLGSVKQFVLFLIAAGWALPIGWAQTTAPRNPEIQAHLQKAQQALRTGDFAAAEREFAAVVALDPNDLDSRGNLGVMRYFQNNWTGAAEQFRKVLTARPKIWKVQAYLGICEARLGRQAEARRLLESAFPHLQTGPFQTQAGLELAQIQYQAGDPDAAVDVMRRLLPGNPRNVDVLYAAARTYADLANRARDALLLTAPQSGRTHQLMAEMLINRGEARAAIAEYRKALEAGPKMRGIHDELGEAILQDSRQGPALEAAEKEFRAALAENSGDAEAEYRLGVIFALRHDYKTAVEHYSRALAIQPNNADAHQGLGSAWSKMGELRRAVEELTTATRLDPLYPTSYYQLSGVYRQLGRADDARREMAEFEKLEQARKQIDQVYVRVRGDFSEPSDAAPTK